MNQGSGAALSFKEYAPVSQKKFSLGILWQEAGGAVTGFMFEQPVLFGRHNGKIEINFFEHFVTANNLLRMCNIKPIECLQNELLRITWYR